VGSNPNLEQEINDHIKTLSRGLMQTNYSVAYQGYNALYRIGEPIIPCLKETILKTDWSNTKYKELSFYLTGVVCLIHDINEEEGKKIIEHVVSNGCPSHIKALLHSLSHFSAADFIKYEVRNIVILAHKDVTAKYDIKPFIEKWLENIPEHDLSELVRIYVVRTEDIDASGTYTPMLYKIALAWNNTFKANSLVFKLFLLSTEHTFYHEIGHHICRHTFGQDPVQEKEADDYAAKIMSKAHLRIGRLVKLLRAIGIIKKK
jgi:hypothetical protein